MVQKSHLSTKALCKTNLNFIIKLVQNRQIKIESQNQMKNALRRYKKLQNSFFLKCVQYLSKKVDGFIKKNDLCRHCRHNILKNYNLCIFDAFC